jgi:SEC-C motif domain protein
MRSPRQQIQRCPCRHTDEAQPLSYSDCCAPLHSGTHAPTPEALMRSRYSAYALGLHTYLLATWHASTAPGDLEGSTIKWMGLEVLAAASQGDAGVVQFVARYKEGALGGGKAGRLTETSRFVREDGQWWYVDGTALMPSNDAP